MPDKLKIIRGEFINVHYTRAMEPAPDFIAEGFHLSATAPNPNKPGVFTDVWVKMADGSVPGGKMRSVKEWSKPN